METILWGMLLFCPFLIIIFILLTLYRKYAALYRQLEGQNELYLAKYQKDFQDLMERERIYHDMKNHLIVLKKYMEEGRQDQAYTYIDRLAATVTAADREEKIGHPILDYLIYEKRRKAAEKDILVREELENLQFMFEGMEAGVLADWCAILGNLWDNAIEGCTRTEEQGWIDFTVKKAGNMVSLKIRNSCRPDVDTRVLDTEKEEKRKHGIGMRSIRYTVDKYYGSIECNCRNGVFEASVVMFL